MLYWLAKFLQLLLYFPSQCNTREQAVPLQSGEFRCKLGVDCSLMTPKLLREWSFVFDEIPSGVHEQHTLNLHKMRWLELRAVGIVWGHTAVQMRASAPTGFFPGE